MTSSRPYLLRALLEWIVDNDCTPHIVVEASMDGVRVPEEHVKDGQIVLNISPSAIQQFELTNEYVAFSARFQGQPREVFVPIAAVAAIFARENGNGMAFTPENGASGPDGPGDEPPRDSRKPSLKVVK